MNEWVTSNVYTYALCHICIHIKYIYKHIYTGRHTGWHRCVALAQPRQCSVYQAVGRFCCFTRGVWVLSHIWMNNVNHVYASCHAAHVWRSRFTRVQVVYHVYGNRCRVCCFIRGGCGTRRCVCVCVFVCVRVCAFVCVRGTRTHTHTRTYMYIFTLTCTQTYARARVRVRTQTHINNQ